MKITNFVNGQEEYLNNVTLADVKAEFPGAKIVRRGRAYFITNTDGVAVFGIQHTITDDKDTLGEIVSDLQSGFNLRIAGELDNSEYPSLLATICRQDAEELAL